MRISQSLHVDVISALLMSALLPGCAKQPAPPVTTPPPTAAQSVPAKNNPQNWNTRTKLPLLLALPLQPILEKDQFNHTMGYIQYPAGIPEASGPAAPFETDQDAVSAARTWIIQHFGELPPEITLNVTSILHSSSGRERPEFGWDLGHTITFEEKYRGIPVTNSGAVIYINGKTHFSASIMLSSFKPIAGSAKPIVNSAGVIATLREPYKASPQEFAAIEERIKPSLCYLWSPRLNHGGRESQVLAPNWVLDGEGRVLMDAYTARIWEND